MLFKIWCLKQFRGGESWGESVTNTNISRNIHPNLKFFDEKKTRQKIFKQWIRMIVIFMDNSEFSKLFVRLLCCLQTKTGWDSAGSPRACPRRVRSRGEPDTSEIGYPLVGKSDTLEKLIFIVFQKGLNTSELSLRGSDTPLFRPSRSNGVWGHE
jgi:hypothetical protein